MFRLSRKVQNIRRYSQFWHSVIDVKPEVEEALKFKGPVVALESTIITHGMPYPQNLETALQVENIVRQQVSRLVKDRFVGIYHLSFICIFRMLYRQQLES